MTSTDLPETKDTHPDFQRSLIEAIHEASPDGILVVDGEGRVISHNQRFCEQFDLSPGKLTGTLDATLVGQADELLLVRALLMIRDSEGFIRRVRELYANPEIDDLDEIELKDDRTLERHSKALWGAGHRYLGRVWFFRDITERKQLQRALEDMSYRDALTGIANRRHFFKRAGEEFARAQRSGVPFSLIFLDIDAFKRINDRWGHASGDRVLSGFCIAAAGVLRHGDLFGRIGGEEFAVLLPATDAAGACALAERLRQRAQAQAVVKAPEAFGYTVSAGVATLAATDESFESVLARADEALYTAKHAGGNVVHQEDLMPRAHGQ